MEFIMDVIHQNPFRILGLPITATDRAFVKSISDLSIFTEMGKTKTFPGDLFFSVRPHRTSESIKKAARQIEQPLDKVFYALFWFWDNPTNTIDAMAFEELNAGNTGKAIHFWEKATCKTITSTNASNYKNLAILYLGLSTDNGTLDKTLFLKSLSLSGSFLANGYFEEFTKCVTGCNRTIAHLETIHAYVDEIISLAKPYLDKLDGVATTEMIKAFAAFPREIQNVILEKFIGTYIHRIDRQIKVAKGRRSDNVSEAHTAGFQLYENTQQDLHYLRTVLSESDLEFQLIADKLADELVQCSVSYFNAYHETENDPGDAALKLAQYAQSIAVGEKVNQRITQGMPILIKYVAEKPKREKLKPAKAAIDGILSAVKHLNITASKPSCPVTSYPNLARRFLCTCELHLTLIQHRFGNADCDYLELCDLVVNNAVEICIAYLNAVAEVNTNHQKRSVLVAALSNVKPVFATIGHLDMSKRTQTRYDELCDKIGLQRSFSAKPVSVPDTSGCYVATMLYGSYNAPEVMVLRTFRDEVLQQSCVGRQLIKIYYTYSPPFVQRTRHMKWLHVILRVILTPFLGYLRGKDE